MNDWVCGHCKSINRPSANSCYSCGGAREVVAVLDPRLVPRPVATLDAVGVGALEGGAGDAATNAATIAAPLAAPGSAMRVPQPAHAVPARTSDVLGGSIAGLVAAVIATAVWYGVVAVSHFQVGIVAIAVGFIVGQGVVLGAKRRGSMALVAISVVLTLLALVASEYLIVTHFVGQQLDVQLDIAQPPDVILGVVYESVLADPLTLAFWAIALFQAVVIPWRSMTATPATAASAMPDAA